MAGASGSKLEAPATQTSSFGVLLSAQHVTAGSTFGGCTTGASGTTTSQLFTGPFGAIREQSHPTGTGTGAGNPAFGKPQQREPATGTSTSISGSMSAFGQPKPAKGVWGCFGKPGSFMITVLLSIRLTSRQQFLLFFARASH